MMRKIVRRGLFPVALLVAVVAGFMLFGPPSASSAPSLADMAPAGAGSGPYSVPETATATEREIATRYETLRNYPDTVDAYVMLGNAYVQRVRETGDPTDYERASAAFDAALTRQPDNVDALIGQGVLRLAQHDFDGALAVGERAAQLSPMTARAQGVVVDALTELGRYDEAVAAAQRMVDLRPDLASLSRVSYQRELRGDVDGAIDAMARAFDAGAGSAVENREYLRVLIGDLHLMKGEIDTAEQIYDASLHTLPGFVWANAGLGRVATAREDHARAVELYRSAADTLPLPEFLVALGEAEEAAGMPDAAAGTMELVGAMQTLFAENGVDVELELALFEANHGDPQTAVELARRAYATQPNVKAADALAWALHRAGQTDEARRYSDEALRLGSPYGPFHYHAGIIALAAGDAEAARQELELALEARGTLSASDAAAAEAALAELR
jgi:tetratricopeptide (TPR) repeat protein